MSTASNASDATSAMAPFTYALEDVNLSSNAVNTSAILCDDSESNAGNATERILSTASDASEATLAKALVTHAPADVGRSSDAGYMIGNASGYADSSMTSEIEAGDATADIELVLSNAGNASDAISAMAPATYASDDVVHSSNMGNTSAITYGDSESNAVITNPVEGFVGLSARALTASLEGATADIR